MENASKALIIAGAVLLAILIIAIGMLIYNNAQNTIEESVQSMSAYDRNQFNAQWTQYQGQTSGTVVRELISKLVTNAKTYEEEFSKLPDLCYKAKSDGNYTTSPADTKGGIVVSTPPGNSNAVATDGINISGFNLARNAIEARHLYNVKMIFSSKSGLVSGIIVEYDAGDTDGSEFEPSYDK